MEKHTGAVIFLFLLNILGCSHEIQAQQSSALKIQGTVALQLNPGENNPRNSEGDFVELKDGRLLFIYTHYTGGSSGDHAPAWLAGRYSSDGGKSWTSQDRVIVEREGDMNVMSVSLLRLQNGKIALFYLKKNSTEDCIPYMRVSGDETKSWSKPIPCITDQSGYFVLNNNRVIQLKNGRLLMAVALHSSPAEKWHNKGILSSYYSDDNGASWKFGGQVPDTTDIITQEPGLLELKNGDVMMFIRASGGVQQLSYSNDGGQTWSHIQASNIKSPISPASMERIPETGDLVLVWNNTDGSNAVLKNIRTPLTIAVSKDDGKTWEHAQNIEDDPDGWYCYIAIHFTKEDVLLSYCAGSQANNTHLSITRITRVPVGYLYK